MPSSPKRKPWSPKKAMDSPLWSVRAIVLISIPVVAITALLVFYFSASSFVTEAGITVGIISLGLFLFLAVGLYHGVRLKEQPTDEEPAALDVGAIDPTIMALPVMDLPKLDLDIPDIGDSGNDLVGCLVSIVLWLVVSIVLMVLFWLLVQVLSLILPWVLLALYWVFYRALKLVFAKASVCRGQLLPSLGYAFLYTALYTGWLFLLLGALQVVRMWSAGTLGG